MSLNVNRSKDRRQERVTVYTIRLMGRFEILDHGKDLTRTVVRYTKGLGIMQYLILCHDTPVSVEKLKLLFWDAGSGNADAALKTTIFRFRDLLRQIDPLLAACITSQRQSYMWVTDPETDIDFLQVEKLLDAFDSGVPAPGRETLYDSLARLYRGPILADSPFRSLFDSEIRSMHLRYQKVAAEHIRLLKAQDRYAEVIDLARKAVRLFPEDDSFYKELIWSIDRIGASREAVEHYRYSAQLQYNYMHVAPGAELQDVYDLQASQDEHIDRQLSVIKDELLQNESHGAFFCDYVVFQEIYDLLALEFSRTKSSIYLGVIALQTKESESDYGQISQHVAEVKELISHNLRKGDIFCLSSPTIFALLLPTANETTGSMVLDRLSRVYYSRFPEKSGTFNYRVYPLLEAQQN